MTDWLTDLLAEVEAEAAKPQTIATVSGPEFLAMLDAHTVTIKPTKHTAHCHKCLGTGQYAKARAVEHCYRCNGSGVEPTAKNEFAVVA